MPLAPRRVVAIGPNYIDIDRSLPIELRPAWTVGGGLGRGGCLVMASMWLVQAGRCSASDGCGPTPVLGVLN